MRERVRTGCALGGVVVVGLDTLELEVDKVVRVERALFLDIFWDSLGGGRGKAFEVEVIG